MDDYKKKYNDKHKTHKPQDLRHGNNIYRACLSKRKYKSYDFAVQMAAKYTEMFGKKQYVYYCPYCFHYHITSLPRKKENTDEQKHDGKSEKGGN